MKIERRKRKHENMKIYTHDEAMRIVEIFENKLCEYDIKIPSPEDDERDPVNDANKHEPGAEVIQYIFRHGIY